MVNLTTAGAAAAAKGFAGAAFNTLTIVLGVLMIGALIWFILFILKFKHKFRVKEVINDRKIVIDDKAREFKDKDGVTFWQLLKKKEKIPIPPAEAIEIDNKGRKCVEAYRTETGEYVYIKDQWRLRPIPPSINEIQDKRARAKLIAQWKSKNNIIESLKPLKTDHRLILVNQIKKAQARKTRNWQELILPIAGISALLILVVSLMIFYSDMGRPLLEMADKQITFEKIRADELSILNEIKNDIQVLKDEEKGKEQKPPS